jgi:hypothetical protein
VAARGQGLSRRLTQGRLLFDRCQRLHPKGSGQSTERAETEAFVLLAALPRFTEPKWISG